MRNFKQNEIPEEEVPEEEVPEYEEVDGEFVWSNCPTSSGVPPVSFMDLHVGTGSIRYYFVEKATDTSEQ